MDSIIKESSMANVKLISCIFTLLILCQHRVKATESLIVNQNSLINTKYSSDISRDNIHIYEFSIPSNIPTFAVQTQISSTNLTTPLFIYGEHDSYVESYSIPFKNQLYPNLVTQTSSVTACPQLDQPATNRDISIRLQTFTTEVIQFSLKVTSIQSNILQIGTEEATAISLASPQYFVHDIPNNVQFLEIQLASPTRLCALVRFTDYSCPPDFTLRSSRAVSGFELTMMTLANLRVRRSDFVGGRMMILLIPVPAAQCETTLEYDSNATSVNFEKNITLSLKSGNPGFLGPILITFAIFIIPYILFAIIIGFDLIFGYFYPKFTKHFAIFTSARRYIDNSTFQEVDNSASDTNVELGEIKEKDESPKTEIEITNERIDGEGDEIFEAYKNGLKNGNLTSTERNSYYYNIINNKDIKVSDLHLTPERDSKRIAQMYPFLVLIIGLFYFLAAFQVSYINYEQLLATGSLDMCYINYRCQRNAGSLLPFNSIWSNIGYLMLSVLFFIVVLIKQMVYTSEVKAQGRPTRGIPQTFSLYYAIALALFFIGILSSIFHICPSTVNFQFDSTYQYVFMVLLYVRMYHNRHPDSNIKPSHVFYLLSLCVIFTSVSLYEDTSDKAARFILTIGIVVTLGAMFYLVHNLFIPQLLLYYYRDWRMNKSILQTLKLIFCPRFNKSRILQMVGIIGALIIGVVVVWTPGLLTTISSGIMLGIAIFVVFYYFYYWLMKIVNKEFVHRPFIFAVAFILLLISGICFAFAFYFWYRLRGNSSLSPAQSREILTDCIFLDYFDVHDMWHIMSSFGLFTLYLSTLLVDENLSLIPQDKIRVF